MDNKDSSSVESIDWTTKAYFGTKKLFNLPTNLEPDLSLDRACEVLEVVSNIISNGKSVAVASDYALATNVEMNPNEVALESLSKQQKEVYQAWEQGKFMLPEIDWDKDRIRCADSPKLVSRAIAMAKVWKAEEATPQHYMHLSQTNKILTDLVVAVDKFEVAKRRVNGGQTNLTPLELAEYQTLRAVSKATNRALMSTRELPPAQVTSKTAGWREVINKRITALKTKLTRA